MAADILFRACKKLLKDNLSSNSPLKHYFFKGDKKVTHDSNAANVEEIEGWSFWEQLPEDIAKNILKRLPSSDRIRMSTVSKSCRIQLEGIPQPPEIPWLMFPYNGFDKHLRFLDMSTDKINRIDMPVSLLLGAGKLSVITSSKGWLVFTKESMISISYYIRSLFKEQVREVEIFLYNPITKALHQLPSLTTKRPMYVVLSSAKIDECIVAVVQFDTINELRSCKPGDNQWSVFNGYNHGDNNCLINDIIFCNNGRLCVLSCDDGQEEGTEKHSVELGKQEVSIDWINFDKDGEGIDIFYDQDSNETGEEFIRCPYLVESSTGELLIILKIIDLRVLPVHGNEAVAVAPNPENPAHAYFKTSAFQVFKMDPITNCFRRIYDMGGEVIFLSSFGCQSRSATEYEGVSGNCIYFLEDFEAVGFEEYIPIVSRESGVYYVDNNKIERYFPSIDIKNHSKLLQNSFEDYNKTWFDPNL